MNGEIIEKPVDSEDAFRILSLWVSSFGCFCFDQVFSFYVR